MFEYNKLKWFWSTLGLNKLDLDEMHPKWVEEMYFVGMGVERYLSDGKQQTAAMHSVSNTLPAIKGKKPMVQVKKLL